MSARHSLDWPVDMLEGYLSREEAWRSWLPGASDSIRPDLNSSSMPSKDELSAALPMFEAVHISLQTEFFTASLKVSKTSQCDGATRHLEPEKSNSHLDKCVEYVLDAIDQQMGPITRFQLVVCLEPAKTSKKKRNKSETSSTATSGCTVTLKARWKGSVPYFGFLFRPLFAAYFKSYLNAALQSLSESVNGFASKYSVKEENRHSANDEASFASAATDKTRKHATRQMVGHPWWAPAQPLTVHQTRALAALCFYAMVMGYMTSLAGIAQHQIIETFHADDAALGRMLFALGIGALPGIFILPLGDRVGRRNILLPALLITAIATGLSAFAPNLVIFTALQTLVRAPLFVALSLAWIYLVEEMPVKGRAYAISLFTMTGGLGGGIGLLSLPWVQRLSPSGWRILFALGLATILVVPSLYRDLPETRRFTTAWHGANPLFLLRKPHLGRVLILLAAAIASSLYGSPATRFQGRYIQNALGYTPGMYVLFTVVTTIPAAPGMLVGGRIADSVGRKTVGILAATVGAVSQALLYWLSGPPLWISSAVGSFVGAMWIPAMGSFSTELFPTSLRANASSATSAAGMAGGAAGSWIAGYLIVSMGTYAAAISALLPAALASGFLIMLLFPETKGKELDEISPEIESPPPGLSGPFMR